MTTVDSPFTPRSRVGRYDQSLSDGQDSPPDGGAAVGSLSIAWGLAHLDGRADERAVLRPRAVVVLHVVEAEQLLQGEPGVRRALADPTVRDHLTVAGDALRLVERLQLVRRLERAVVVRGLDPRDVRRAGDVAGHLRLLLREVVGRQLLAPELLGRAHVDESDGADLRDDLVAHRANLGTLLTEEHVLRTRIARHLGHELTALELPLLAAAVEHLHVVEAAKLEQPVRVGREPVVVAAIENDRGGVAHASVREELREAILILVVPPDGGVQVGVPVPADGPTDVALLVGGCVLVDLDQTDVGGVEMLLQPLGRHECIGVRVVGHWALLERCRWVERTCRSFRRGPDSTDGTGSSRRRSRGTAFGSLSPPRRSEDPERCLRLVGHHLGAPRRPEHELGPDIAEVFYRRQEGAHLVLDQRSDRASHGRQAVADVHVAVVLHVDLVDESEIDDVDAELRVVDLHERLTDALLHHRRRAGVARCVVCLRLDVVGHAASRRPSGICLVPAYANRRKRTTWVLSARSSWTTTR